MIVTTVPVEAATTKSTVKKATVNVGESFDFNSTYDNLSPKWTSSNINVARVDNEGTVTAISTGKAQIKARVGTKFELFTVNTVTPTLKLNKDEITLYSGVKGKGASQQLKATVKGANKNIVWSSVSDNIATVDIKGKVTAVSPGTTIVTVSANTLVKDCVVTVKEPSISLNRDSVELSTSGVGKSTKLRATIDGPSNKVKWTTSDKKVATVANGTVVGKSTGTAVITATANGVTVSCNVDVNKDRVSFNKEDISLFKGTTQKLKFSGTPDSVSSSNPEIATVSTNGIVEAISPGNVTLYATKGDYTDTCLVEVKDIYTNIVEDEIELELYGNKTYTLGSEVSGKSKSTSWKSSNSKVVSVSKGKLTAKKLGTAEVTLKANGITDTVQVNVVSGEPSIKLNYDSYELVKGSINTVTLKATVKGAGVKPIWLSSNKDVATVNKSGKVTAKGVGQTVIAASVDGDKVIDMCVITVKAVSPKLDYSTLILAPGETKDIGVDVIGNKSASYKTSNKKVATVKAGVVTAVAVGEADITITAGGVKSVCKVVVQDCQHEYVETVATEPTCSKDGSKIFQCSKCKAEYPAILPATGEHKFSKLTANGICGDYVKHYNTCEDCGYVVTEYAIKEHKYGDWTPVYNGQERVCEYCGNIDYEKLCDHVYGDWFADVVEGVHAKVCSLCNERIVEDHVYSSWVSDNDITHTHVCNVCDFSVTEDHTMTEWVVVNGYATRNCTACDYKEEVEHVCEFSDWETTETTHTRKCSMCGIVESDAHVFTGWTVSGNDNIRSCSVCGYVESLTHVHEYSEWEATADSHSKTCAMCGDVVLTAHDFSDWAITEETDSRYCGVCNYVETRTHEHEYSEWVCDYNSHYKTCATCGNVVTEDHNYVEVGGEGLCSKQVCQQCNDTKTVAHVYGDWIVDAEGHHNTCTLCGDKLLIDHDFQPVEDRSVCSRSVCSTCKRELVVEHKYGDYEVTETSHIRVCENCGSRDVGGHNYKTIEPLDKCSRKACVVCKNEISTEHEWNPWVPEELVHTRSCANCDATESVNHEVDMNSCDNQVCPVCDKEVVLTHVYGDWEASEEGCSRVCTKCNKPNIIEHSYTYTYVDNDKHHAVCVVCTYECDLTHNSNGVYSASEDGCLSSCLDCSEEFTVPHNYDGNVCTICDFVDYNANFVEHKLGENGICVDCGEYVPGFYNSEGVMVANWYQLEGIYNLTNSNFAQVLDDEKFIDVKTVVLDESVTVIGKEAFYGCSELESVVMTNSVKVVSDDAFNHCESLANVVFSNNLETIGKAAFRGCPLESYITIPTSVTSIGDNAFLLADFLFYDGVAEGAPWGATAVVPTPTTEHAIRVNTYTVNTLETDTNCILCGEYVPGVYNSNGCLIEDWSTLESNYGLNVTEAGNFLNVVNALDTDVMTVVVPCGVETITVRYFYQVSEIQCVVLPEGVTDIDEQAFKDCTSLVNVVLPNSLTSVGERAFSGCPLLKNTVIPSSVTSIGSNAFYGSTYLKYTGNAEGAPWGATAIL